MSAFTQPPSPSCAQKASSRTGAPWMISWPPIHHPNACRTRPRYARCTLHLVDHFQGMGDLAVECRVAAVGDFASRVRGPLFFVPKCFISADRSGLVCRELGGDGEKQAAIQKEPLYLNRHILRWPRVMFRGHEGRSNRKPLCENSLCAPVALSLWRRGEIVPGLGWAEATSRSPEPNRGLLLTRRAIILSAARFGRFERA